MDNDIKFCPCGLVLVNGLCRKHGNKPPIKKEKAKPIRGRSVWAEKEGFFTGLEE